MVGGKRSWPKREAETARKDGMVVIKGKSRRKDGEIAGGGGDD